MNALKQTLWLGGSLLLAQAALASTLDGVAVPDQIQHGQFGNARTGQNVLLVQTGDGWNIDHVAHWLGLGANVTSIAPADLPSTPLSPYCLVVLELQSASGAAAQIAAVNGAAGTVDAYVAGGGTLMYSGGHQDFALPVFLPGGAYAELNGSSYTGSNPFVNAAHPILAGLSNPLVGSYANHDALYNLPMGADVILHNAIGEPCAVEYNHGAGTVVAITGPAGAYAPNFDTAYGLWLNTTSYCLGICEGGGTVAADETPAGFQLGRAYPNPFNPTTTLSFQVEETSAVQLQVWNLAGGLVATLVDGRVERGSHEVEFDASLLASGVYVATLSDGRRMDSRKLVLVK